MNVDYAKLPRREMRQQLSACLAEWIDDLEDMYSNLKRRYSEEALGKLEKYFCDMGAWFHSLAFAYGNPYRQWIDRSYESKELAAEIEEKAYKAARALEKKYSRTRCRKQITDLLDSIRNLKFRNDKR